MSADRQISFAKLQKASLDERFTEIAEKKQAADAAEAEKPKKRILKKNPVQLLQQAGTQRVQAAAARGRITRQSLIAQKRSLPPRSHLIAVPTVPVSRGRSRGRGRIALLQRGRGFIRGGRAGSAISIAYSLRPRNIPTAAFPMLRGRFRGGRGRALRGALGKGRGSRGRGRSERQNSTNDAVSLDDELDAYMHRQTTANRALDDELDAYMGRTSSLDKELDDYHASASAAISSSSPAPAAASSSASAADT